MQGAWAGHLEGAFPLLRRRHAREQRGGTPYRAGQLRGTGKRRGTGYELGPLPRAAAESGPRARSLPPQFSRPWWSGVHLRSDRLWAALGLLCLWAILTISRSRTWRRSHAVLGAPDRRTAEVALYLMVLLRLSRLRQRRRRMWPQPDRLRRLVRPERQGAEFRFSTAPLANPVEELGSLQARRRPALVASPPPHGSRWSTDRAYSRLMRGRGARSVSRSTRSNRFWVKPAVLVAVISLLAALGSVDPALWSTSPVPSSINLALPSRVSPIVATAAPAPTQAAVQFPKQDATSLQSVVQMLDTYKVAWPYDIVDGLTFGPEGAAKTHLAGLEGPARDAVCKDKFDQPWACGLQARAALNNVTRRQALTCTPSGPFKPGLPIPARCRGEVDVARELVAAGFARPTGRDPDLESAEDEARRNERGLWNGGWTVRMAAR